MNKSVNNDSQAGVAAIFLVVAICITTLIVASAVSFIGLSQLEENFVASKSSETMALTEGCAEEIMRRIRLDSVYGVGLGVINIALINGSCDVLVTDMGSDQRRIDITGQVSDYNKVVQIDLTVVDSLITINDWQQLTN